MPGTGKTLIDTVVFDLGGVLIDWNVAALFGPMLPAEPGVEEFADNLVECVEGLESGT